MLAHSDEPGLSLTDMTRASGCTARTVRFYEREGLLQATRTGGGHRLFSPSQLERLKFIVALREAGWSLPEIAELLALRGPRRSDRDACRAIASTIEGHEDALEQKIRTLLRLRDDLAATRSALAVCAACTQTGSPDCESCTRLSGELPSGFRLTWRGAAGRRRALPVVSGAVW